MRRGRQLLTILAFVASVFLAPVAWANYDPAEGRFLENDPNGLGGVVLSDLTFGGRPATLPSERSNLEVHYSSGMNAHTAYSQVPASERDPTGLFADIGADMFGMVWGLTFGSATAAYESVIIHYAANLEADVDWAGDWEAKDNEYSRLSNRWIDIAVIEGVAQSFVQSDGLLDLVSIDLSDELDIGSGFDLLYGWAERDRQQLPQPGRQTMAGPASGAGESLRGASRVSRGNSRLEGVSRQLYNYRRQVFKRERMRAWRKEVFEENPAKYTKQQKTRVKSNRAPIGSDGESMVIHHKTPLRKGGTNDPGNFEFMNASEHRRRYKKLHYRRRERMHNDE